MLLLFIILMYISLSSANDSLLVVHFIVILYYGNDTRQKTN